MKIIKFPQKEKDDIVKRFLENKIVFTIRVSKECEKFKKGDVLNTEWGDTVKVIELNKISGGITELRKEYQYINELTADMIDELSSYSKMEIISLKKI